MSRSERSTSHTVYAHLTSLTSLTAQTLGGVLVTPVSLTSRLRSRGPLRLGTALATLLFALTLLLAGPSVSQAAPTPPKDPKNIGVLVNKNRPLKPKNYVPRDLVKIGSAKVRKEPAKHLRSMMAAAKKAKKPLVIVSSYRSYTKQKSLFSQYSRWYGVKYASTISARPGYSEHQTGLTVDLGKPGGGCTLSTCFGTTKAGKWVASNAWKYGYIIRYPKGYTKVTGYSYEPWHVRYVGKKIATKMHQKKIRTLEAYYGLKR